MIDCKLHMLLAEKRMTQKELSEATGIGQNSISRYCNNTWVKFDKEHLEKLCIYFSCNVEDIITYKEDTAFVNETLDKALEYLNEVKNKDENKFNEASAYISNIISDMKLILENGEIKNIQAKNTKKKK